MLTKTDIEKYFMAEKQLGLVFFIIGIVAIVLAVVCYFLLKTGFYKGAAIPLVLIGLMEVTTGWSVYKKSDDMRVRNVYAFDMNPYELKEKELPRVQKLSKTLEAYKIAEALLVVAGIVLVLVFRSQPGKAFWIGLGAALILQGLIMFCTEYTVAARTKAYAQKLQAFVEKK